MSEYQMRPKTTTPAVQRLEALLPDGMIDEDLVIIRFVSGFERGSSMDGMGCHESWCRTWRVSDRWGVITANSFDFEKAVGWFCDRWENPTKWMAKRALKHDLPEWHPLYQGNDDE